jgi:hypothetical protein
VARLTAGLLLALAAAASAQSPMPYSGDAPATSSAPAVSSAAAVAASTEAVVAVSTEGVKVAGETKPKLTRPIRATIHRDAKDWEPLSLKAGGDPFQAENKAVLLLEKVKRKYKGQTSKAKSFARLRPGKDESWLVISVFPKALERRRGHFEVRLRIVEGFVEDVKATLVSVVDRNYTGAGMDSDELRRRGVEFEEDSPSAGQILVSALDPKPSKTAFNAGILKEAAFAAKDVRLCDVSWSVKGLTKK